MPMFSAIVVAIWQFFCTACRMTQLSGSPLSVMITTMIAYPSYLDQATKKIFTVYVQCGLIREAKNNRLKTVNLVPSIESMGHQYSWADFIAENMLNIETSYIYPDGSKIKTYFIRIGRFATQRFTILDQINGSMKFKFTTMRDRQKSFIESVAREEIAFLSSPISPGITVGTSAESITLLQELLPSEKESYRSSINVKNILQVHFFEKNLKEGADINQLLVVY
jgi:hypothetical protein